MTWTCFPDPHGNGRRILVIVFLFAERKSSRDVVWDCLSQELDGSSWPSTREAKQEDHWIPGQPGLQSSTLP